jgi:hypothetical protein
MYGVRFDFLVALYGYLFAGLTPRWDIETFSAKLNMLCNFKVVMHLPLSTAVAKLLYSSLWRVIGFGNGDGPETESYCFKCFVGRRIG